MHYLSKKSVAKEKKLIAVHMILIVVFFPYFNKSSRVVLQINDL